MKKTRKTLSIKKAVLSVRKATQSVTNKDKSPTKDSPSMATTDERLFFPLPQEHEWRKLSPGGIREVIIKKLTISPALFGKVKPVHSGFVLNPCSTEAREIILNAGNRLFLSGAKLESATNWTPVIVPTLPATIRKEQGEVEVSKSMLTDEIERVCHIRPAHVKLKFKKLQPLEFCKRCNGYHPKKNCSRAPSCGNCGSTNHTEELCIATTECKNCGVPHRSDRTRCFARPTRSGAPTKE
ncbi:hypothetical protein EPUL_004462 [Erysiphe pulchra]|uniref:Gag-like protein n=1 Tax=Erysiphe pulchra TaxID=225359 RepID=A0A2S4PPQ2_9PEZI|nr:hypothetical protein EPUL_004462 [Erysiphe pulchra]